ncbi:Vacuolar morphoproteinsis protein 6 [Savitreella phatthalungensis]
MHMHRAFDCRLVTDVQKGIAVIHAYGNKLLVCDSACTLTHYAVDERLEGGKGHLHSLKTVKAFSRSKPQQLYAVKETQTLIVLADGYISLYGLTSLELQQRLDGTKGASLFCVDSSIDHTSGVPVVQTQVAVCVRRQVLLYTWRDSEFEQERHFTLPDKARAAEFLTPRTLVLGLGSDFCSLELATGDVQAIQVAVPGPGAMSYLGRQARPLLANTAGQMLLVRDLQSSFIDADCNVLRSKSIDWSSAPEHIGFTYPYLVVVLKSRVEVRNARLGTLLQTFDIASVSLLNPGKHLFLATSHKIFRLDALPYGDQIETLIVAGALEQAQSVLELLDSVLLDNKEGLLRRVKALQAQALFEKEEYERSMDLYGDAWAVPSDIVRLLPAQEEEDDSWRTAYSAMAAFLARTRRLLARFISAPPMANSTQQYLTAWPECTPLSIQQLEEELGIADTTLLKIYIASSPGLVGSLVRLSNRCDPAVVRDYLVREGRWRELVDFYFSKRLYDDAFSLLQEKHAPALGLQLMQRLNNDDWDVIKKWSPWLLHNHEDAIEIFTEPSNENESFERPAVIQLLTGIDKQYGIKYLEHVTIALDDTTPRFSEQLLELYLDQDKSEDLLTFLNSSHCHASPQRFYDRLPKTPAYLEARAILLARMGRLRAALEVYVHEVRDRQKSEAFAIQQHPASPDAFEILLDIYLSSEPAEVVGALELLKRHGPRLDAEVVLRKLPGSVPVQLIQQYLSTRLRDNLRHGNATAIETALRRSDLITAQEALLHRRATPHLVTTHTLCAACGKRLGNAVLASFPNGALTHYGCRPAYNNVHGKVNKGNAKLTKAR